MTKSFRENLALGATFASLMTAGLYAVGQYYGIPELKEQLKRIDAKVTIQGESIARIEGKLNAHNINKNDENYVYDQNYVIVRTNHTYRGGL